MNTFLAFSPLILVTIVVGFVCFLLVSAEISKSKCKKHRKIVKHV